MNRPPTSPPRSAPAPEPWYRRAFRAGYLDLYAHRNEEDAARAVEFIQDRLRPRPETRLLDLCCGAGRHLMRLLPRVGLGVGLDLSRVLLDRARETYDHPSPQPSQASPRAHGALVQGDMRALPFAPASFDLAVNLFTSMGYFDSDEENRGVLGEVARVLVPGGDFVLDHINRPHLERSLEARTERRLDGGVRVIESRRFDAQRRRIHKRVEWIESEGRSREWTESVRVYEFEELTSVLQSVGLQVTQCFGDYDARAHDSNSPRMIILARRQD